jgi:hypothetical protein
LIWQGEVAQRASEEEAWKGVLLPASGLQHEVGAGRLQVVERMADSDWKAIFEMGRVDPGQALAAADDKGVAVWAGLASAVGGNGAVAAAAAAAADDVVYGTSVRRAELADMALSEWAAAFLDPS